MGLYGECGMRSHLRKAMVNMVFSALLEGRYPGGRIDFQFQLQFCLKFIAVLSDPCL